MSRSEKRKNEKRIRLIRNLSITAICLLLACSIFFLKKETYAAPKVYEIGDNVRAVLGTEPSAQNNRANYCDITLIDPSKPRIYKERPLGRICKK